MMCDRKRGKVAASRWRQKTPQLFCSTSAGLFCFADISVYVRMAVLIYKRGQSNICSQLRERMFRDPGLFLTPLARLQVGLPLRPHGAEGQTRVPAASVGTAGHFCSEV